MFGTNCQVGSTTGWVRPGDSVSVKPLDEPLDGMYEPVVRRASSADYDAVVAFTRETWRDRDVGDYLPDVFLEWVDADGPDQYTAVGA